MPITPAKDKAAIKSILNADPLMTTLGFTAAQTFTYKNSDQTIDPNKIQIFIYNVHKLIVTGKQIGRAHV